MIKIGIKNPVEFAQIYNSDKEARLLQNLSNQTGLNQSDRNNSQSEIQNSSQRINSSLESASNSQAVNRVRPTEHLQARSPERTTNNHRDLSLEPGFICKCIFFLERYSDLVISGLAQGVSKHSQNGDL